MVMVAIFCVLIAVIGVIAYRVSMRSVVWRWRQGKKYSLINDDIGSKVCVEIILVTGCAKLSGLSNYFSLITCRKDDFWKQQLLFFDNL